MNGPALSHPSAGRLAVAPPLPQERGSFGAVVLRHLRTPAQVAAVLHLREEIDLSVHAAADPQHFSALEKKETNAALSMASTSRVKRSAPSDSCRWATS